MAFDTNNFVIDHVIRGVMFSNADGSYMWGVNQITNPSLSIQTDTSQAVDALGVAIATFNRAKTAEFSAENSLFDLPLLAAQQGTEKKIASSSAKVLTPALETINVTGATSVTLKHTPVSDIKEIFVLKGDGTFGTRYASGVSATAEKFVYSDGTITLPTGLKPGTQLIAMYDYEAEEAVAVEATASEYPKAGKFVMEVLGTDVCDTTTLIHAYIVFPNAKLNADVDLDFTTEGTHPFTLVAQQDYCDSKKTLFKVIIPKED